VELSPETVKMLLEHGIPLRYKIVSFPIHALFFYLFGRFVVLEQVRGFTKILQRREKKPPLNDF